MILSAFNIRQGGDILAVSSLNRNKIYLIYFNILYILGINFVTQTASELSPTKKK
jgi:hypothetical protein